MKCYELVFGEGRDLDHLVDKSSKLEKAVKEIGSKWLDIILKFSVGVYGSAGWIISNKLSSFGNYRNNEKGKAPFEKMKFKNLIYAWNDLELLWDIGKDYA